VQLDTGSIRVSVVICAYTELRWGQLQRAVDSVRAQSKPAHEVLVVVDHNDALLRRATAELDARVLRNGDVQGLSGARNTGVAAARGDVVAFLDDDAYAEPDWLERLVEPYADPRVVAVGGDVRADFEAGRPAFLPPSSTGSSGAPTAANRPCARTSATPSGPTCPCGAVCSSKSARSSRRSAAWASARWVAKRPSCASGQPP
jgi:glycosyltransferase involved in cell wall biosynthesis